MWTCGNCNELIDDQLDACWKCGCSREGKLNLDFMREPCAIDDDSSLERKPMFDELTIFVTLVISAAVIVTALLAPGDMQITKLVSGPAPLTFFCISTLGSLPIAFAMPRLRVSFFGRMWHVPSSTYVLSRWIVRLCIGASLGQVAGFVVLAILQDHRLFWLVGSFALISGAFCAGASRRFRQHPKTEFVMRWWP